MMSILMILPVRGATTPASTHYLMCNILHFGS